MSLEDKIQSVNNYVEKFLFRHGFTLYGTISLSCNFRLTNINTHNADNFFEVSSEEEAKEIAKAFLINSFNDELFNKNLFNKDKPIYLVLDVKLPE